jgi:hypothetical protein
MVNTLKKMANLGSPQMVSPIIETVIKQLEPELTQEIVKVMEGNAGFQNVRAQIGTATGNENPDATQGLGPSSSSGSSSPRHLIAG